MIDKLLLMHKQRKYLFIILAVVVVVIVASIIKRNFFKTGLPALVEEKSEQLYKISYDSLDVDELKGNVSIKNVVIVADTALQNRYLRTGSSNASQALFSIVIPSIDIVGLKTAKALLTKRIMCDRIIINYPQAIINLYKLKNKEDIKKQGERFYKQLLGNFKQIQATKIEINNASIIAQDHSSQQKIFQAFNTSINLTNFRVDSVSNNDTTRTFFSEQLVFKTERIAAGDKKATVMINHAVYATIDEKLSIRDIIFDSYNNGGILNKWENIVADKLMIHGPPDALQITVNNVETSDISLLTQKQQKSKQQANTKSKMILPDWLKLLSVNNFKINNIAYKQMNATKKEPIVDVNNTTISVSKLRLDSTSEMGQSLSTMFGVLKINNPKIDFKSGDNLYRYTFSGLKLDAINETLYCSDFVMKPLLNETAFQRQSKLRVNRYDLSFQDIKCSHINIAKLINGEVDIKRIDIAKTYFKDFIDLSYPYDNKSRLGKYPWQLLFKMDMPVQIEKVFLSDGYIEYKEKNPVSDSSGRVRFLNANIEIENITNHPVSKEWCTVKFNANFLGATKVNATLKIDLQKQQQGIFSLSGSLKAVAALQFNQIMIPMSLSKFEKGIIKNASFNFNGDNYGMQGKVQMEYDDLKIVFLKKNEDDKLKKKNLKTLIANLFVRNSNYKKHGNQQVAVDYKRDTTRSLFYTIWKAIFTGLQDIIVIVK